MPSSVKPCHRLPIEDRLIGVHPTQRIGGKYALTTEMEYTRIRQN
jgi:hypothetical protein